MNEPLRNTDGEPLTLFGKPIIISNDPELRKAQEALKGAAFFPWDLYRAMKATTPRDEATIPHDWIGEAR